MQELSEFSGGTVSLGVRDRLSMLYIESCRSTAALALTLDVGSRIPLGTSAIGRAWLAAVPAREREEVMEQIHELDDVAWPGVRRGIEQGVSDHAELGVTCSFGEWQKDVNGIARAFEPGGGLPVMAINVGGPSFSLTPKFLLDEVKPRLLHMIAQLEAAIAGR
jgi:DNA-binding IclR family transcriptional regulator